MPDPCQDCARPRTSEEIHWYGQRDGSGRCETCERAWSERMGRWMRGETIEPELDSIFRGPSNGRETHEDGCPSGDFGPCDCPQIPSKER